MSREDNEYLSHAAREKMVSATRNKEGMVRSCELGRGPCLLCRPLRTMWVHRRAPHKGHLVPSQRPGLAGGPPTAPVFGGQGKPPLSHLQAETEVS